jgi:preprotein translocase subunit SecD
VRRRVIVLIITVVAIAGTFVATIFSDSRPVLGLDLQGGISIVLFPVKGSDLSALNTATDVIRNRVDGLGIAEPDVQRQGDTIVVNLPGVKDRAKAENLVGETAELRFREVSAQYPWAADNTSTTTSKGGTSKGSTSKGGTSTSTGKGATTTAQSGDTSTTAANIGPASTVASSTSGKALGVATRTINTAPIAKRFRAATTDSSAPTTAAPTTAAPTTVAGGSTTVGGLTPTTIPPSTTTLPPQAFPGCAKLIKQSPPDTDTAQQVILPDRTNSSCYVLGAAIVTGKSVGSSSVIYDSTSSQWAANVHFKNNDFLDKIAGPLVNKQVAIELDGVVQSAPTINPGITGRDVEITGAFTQGEAKQLSLVLRYGALPVQFDQSKQTVESVSPTLGKDQLTAGIVSGLIGLGLVALYMLLFYRLLGLVVVVGLGLTGMLFFTAVSYLSSSHGLTLTLAGVTGIIVSVGVTVDSYVVYFERLKDEVRTGKTVRSSLEVGFTRSFRTIVAADLVSLLGAVVLYLFATSSVRGFAFFLGLSTVMDLLLAWAFMHPMVSVLARRPKLVQLPGIGIASALDVQGATA